MVHVVELIVGLKNPEEQFLQVDDIVVNENVPLGQAVHVLAIDREKKPSTHIRQLDDAGTLENVPPRHCKQTVEPLVLLYAPAGHWLHTDRMDVFVYVPSAQRMQVEELEREYVPDVQL